jgi:hypothetical protein
VKPSAFINFDSLATFPRVINFDSLATFPRVINFDSLATFHRVVSCAVEKGLELPLRARFNLAIMMEVLLGVLSISRRHCDGVEKSLETNS